MEKVQKDRSLEDGLRRMEDGWIGAYLGGDMEGFANLLTDACVYTGERGIFDKRSYVRNLASGLIEMRGLRDSENEVRLHGSTAISTGAATPNATDGDRDIGGVDRITRVWAGDGVWRRRAARQQHPEGGPSRR